MQRRLVLNWCDAHRDLKRALEDGVKDPLLLPPAGKGWTYVTFCPIGTRPSNFLFDVERVRALAEQNKFSLPHDIVAQHNKVVVMACSDDGRHSTQLFGLFRLLKAYSESYGDTHKRPRHGFYGKLGGIWERPEKGRVWAIYTSGDDALLEVYQSVEKLVAENKLEGVRFVVGLSNGLSALPRVLHGFDDPEYRRSGAHHYRITDRSKFHIVLDQALTDYSRYYFE